MSGELLLVTFAEVAPDSDALRRHHRPRVCNLYIRLAPETRVRALPQRTKGSSHGAGLPWPTRDTSFSSIWEEIGVLWLVPARTMRATAAECLLPLTSHAIRKHLRDRGAGAGVAPYFMTKRDSELVDIRDRAPTTPSAPRLANTREAPILG